MGDIRLDGRTAWISAWAAPRSWSARSRPLPRRAPDEMLYAALVVVRVQSRPYSGIGRPSTTVSQCAPRTTSGKSTVRSRRRRSI